MTKLVRNVKLGHLIFTGIACLAFLSSCGDLTQEEYDDIMRGLNSGMATINSGRTGEFKPLEIDQKPVTGCLKQGTRYDYIEGTGAFYTFFDYSNYCYHDVNLRIVTYLRGEKVYERARVLEARQKSMESCVSRPEEEDFCDHVVITEVDR
jgi:hypothetical protein